MKWLIYEVVNKWLLVAVVVKWNMSHNFTSPILSYSLQTQSLHSHHTALPHPALCCLESKYIHKLWALKIHHYRITGWLVLKICNNSILHTHVKLFEKNNITGCIQCTCITDDTDVFRVHTVMDSCSTMPALLQSLFHTTALHIVQKYWSTPTTKFIEGKWI